MWIVVLCCGWVPGRLVIRHLRSCESERMTWSHTKSLCRVELIFFDGLCGQRTWCVWPRVRVELLYGIRKKDIDSCFYVRGVVFLKAGELNDFFYDGIRKRQSKYILYRGHVNHFSIWNLFWSSGVYVVTWSHRSIFLHSVRRWRRFVGDQLLDIV